MDVTAKWHGKRYYSLDAYLKNTYGQKFKKISIDAGFTCPNRDGTLGSRGCIFCSAGGSGDFALPYGSVVAAEPYIAYFQAYTCTYAPVASLDIIYRSALEDPLVIGISIATRPDCLPPEVLSLLADLKIKYPEKFIWIELGLQTIHERTAEYIRRGYSLPARISPALFFPCSTAAASPWNTRYNPCDSWASRRNQGYDAANDRLSQRYPHIRRQTSAPSYIEEHRSGTGL